LVILHLPSNAKAKHCSTWSLRQVNRRWLRATLQPVKMCLYVASDEHKGQEGSSPTQRFRFCGDGRTSYVELRKLILLSSIDQRPCQPILRCSTLSLLGLGNALYTPHPLLLLSHLVDYKLNWACLVPFRRN